MIASRAVNITTLRMKRFSRNSSISKYELDIDFTLKYEEQYIRDIIRKTKVVLVFTYFYGVRHE